MPRSSMTLAVAVVCLSLLSGVPAHADDKEQAGELFKQGNDLRVAEKYAEALEKYKAAYKLLPSFKIAFNVALTQEKLGNYPAAYTSYRYFLKTGEGKSPEKMLRLARDKLALLAQKIALVKVTSSVAGATVKVNGINVGKTPLPGDWEMAIKAQENVSVWVEAEDYQTFTRSLQLNPGQAVTVEVVLKPMPKPKTPTVVEASQDAEGEITYQQNQKRRSKTIWAWTTLGVGLACAVGAGVLYGVGSSQVNKAYDAYSTLDSSYTDESFDNEWADVESAGNLYIGGHVLAGVAAAAVGVSIYMFMTRPAVEREVAASTGGWRLGITAGGRQASFVVSGGF